MSPYRNNIFKNTTNDTNEIKTKLKTIKNSQDSYFKKQFHPNKCQKYHLFIFWSKN